MYKRLILVLFATAIFPALLLGACQSGDDDDDTTPVTTRTATRPSGSASATATTTPFVLEGGTVTPSGLQYRDEVVGTGESPRMDQQVTVHYEGRFAESGEKFDSSYDRGQPATFSLQGVIKGFAEGISTMKVGGKRTVYIPSNLGYGAAGNPPRIPPNADLMFEIELIAIK